MYLKKLNKDKIRRVISNFFEIQIKVFKSLCNFSNIYNVNKIFYIGLLENYFKLKRNCYFNRINNLCILTGRQSGIYKYFKISRIQLRSSNHNIFGIRKSS